MGTLFDLTNILQEHGRKNDRILGAIVQGSGGKRKRDEDDEEDADDASENLLVAVDDEEDDEDSEEVERELAQLVAPDEEDEDAAVEVAAPNEHEFAQARWRLELAAAAKRAARADTADEQARAVAVPCAMSTPASDEEAFMVLQVHDAMLAGRRWIGSSCTFEPVDDECAAAAGGWRASSAYTDALLEVEPRSLLLTKARRFADVHRCRLERLLARSPQLRAWAELLEGVADMRENAAGTVTLVYAGRWARSGQPLERTFDLRWHPKWTFPLWVRLWMVCELEQSVQSNSRYFVSTTRAGGDDSDKTIFDAALSAVNVVQRVVDDNNTAYISMMRKHYLDAIRVVERFADQTAAAAVDQE